MRKSYVLTMITLKKISFDVELSYGTKSNSVSQGVALKIEEHTSTLALHDPVELLQISLNEKYETRIKFNYMKIKYGLRNSSEISQWDKIR